jgi:hypothetical protein
VQVLGDPANANRLADAAHDRVRSGYLAPHYLANYLELVAAIDDD